MKQTGLTIRGDETGETNNLIRWTKRSFGDVIVAGDGTFVGERANETKFDNSCRKSSQKAQNERTEAERGFD